MNRYYRADSIGQRNGMRTIYEITPGEKRAVVVVPNDVVIDVVEALNHAADTARYACTCCISNECECKGGHIARKREG